MKHCNDCHHILFADANGNCKLFHTNECMSTLAGNKLAGKMWEPKQIKTPKTPKAPKTLKTLKTLKTPTLHSFKKTRPTELCYLLNCNEFECSECIIDTKVESFKILITYAQTQNETQSNKTILIK